MGRSSVCGHRVFPGNRDDHTETACREEERKSMQQEGESQNASPSVPELQLQLAFLPRHPYASMTA